MTRPVDGTTRAVELDFRKDPRVLSQVVDSMAVGVFTVDARGRFVAWSEGAERITGYPSEEVVGRPCGLLEGPNCKGFRTVAELLEGGGPAPEGLCNQECKILARDGGERYLHGSVRVLADEAGRPIGAVGTFTDLTSFMAQNERIALLEQRVGAEGALARMVGRSAPMREVFLRVQLAARSDATVLITGESGTGKELAARAIHDLGERRDRPFVAINCAGLPETLLESELFGHEKGAFTGAIRAREGLFQAARGGTLFLDEVGDVSLALQTRLLRVLEDREVRPVGSDRSATVDVRLIAATNKDLRALVREKAMREDFYYRVHVFEVPLPPLRARIEDVPLLLDHFIRANAEATGKAIRSVARDALDAMRRYAWPGNVRELRNAVEHAFVTASGDTIHLLDLPPTVRGAEGPGRPVPSDPEAAAREEAERQEILDALRQAGGVKARAAKLLGYSRVTLWKKMKRLGLGG